jgi:ATP-binding cassette subfamily B protein
MAWLGEKIVHDLRVDMYNHLQTLSLDFYDQRQTGWILDRVSHDTSNLQDFLAEGFQDFIRDIMVVAVIVAIMFAMNWSLTLITLIPAPLVVFLTVRFMRRVRRLYHSVWRKRSLMTSLLSNVLPGVRVVKAFAQEERESERFFDRSKDFMTSNVKASRTFAAFHPITGFVTSLGFVMVWGFGGYQVITGGTVTLGTLIAFISYLWRFYGPLNNLSRFSRRVQRAFTAAQRVFEVLDTEPSVPEPKDGRHMPQITGDVAFKNVTFAYEPGQPVLQNISFEVRSGEMIGLVGPSGAGKSTTINLLCRFYDAEEGAIEIDGYDIRSVTLHSLRSQIGVVLQEPFLFHGTVAQNIAYGNPDASRESIIRAAKAANAHDFIMQFSEGYDTLVGERGQRLSGGERQRISIARAILKNPRILILDEATSSVDTETEIAIQEAVDRLVRGRTTFAIAHRFSTLKNADRLVVLDEGKVVEIGSHEELLAREDGLFRRLCDMQTKNSQIIAVAG